MLTGSETKRAKLRLTVHTGYTGNRPDRLRAALPVKDGEVILSGQVISVRRNTVTGRNEWVRGHTHGTDALNSIYFAFDDSADGDVRAAGNLQGLSVRGEYELSSAHYKAAENYIAGDELTYDGVTGNFKKAVSNDRVIAVVVKDYAAPVNLGATYTPKEGSANVSDGVQGGSFTIARHSNAANLTRVRFVTVQPYIKA